MDKDLIDLLELAGEQTIEGVFETNITLAQPLSHAVAHATRNR
jgi:hypothetical protein